MWVVSTLTLDGALAKGSIGGMQPTPGGVVMHENPLPAAARPNCVIEGTRYQLETPGEFLQRYSDLVRENRKQELKDAMSMILPAVSDFEILTDEKGDSYLSGVTAGGRQLPLQGVWDFASRAFAPLAQFLHQLALRAGGTPQAAP